MDSPEQRTREFLKKMIEEQVESAIRFNREYGLQTKFIPHEEGGG